MLTNRERAPAGTLCGLAPGWALREPSKPSKAIDRPAPTRGFDGYEGGQAVVIALRTFRAYAAGAAAHVRLAFDGKTDPAYFNRPVVFTSSRRYHPSLLIRPVTAHFEGGDA